MSLEAENIQLRALLRVADATIRSMLGEARSWTRTYTEEVPMSAPSATAGPSRHQLAEALRREHARWVDDAMDGDEEAITAHYAIPGCPYCTMLKAYDGPETTEDGIEIKRLSGGSAGNTALMLEVVQAAQGFDNGGGCFCDTGGPIDGKFAADHHPDCLRLSLALRAYEAAVSQQTTTHETCPGRPEGNWHVRDDEGSHCKFCGESYPKATAGE